MQRKTHAATETFHTWAGPLHQTAGGQRAKNSPSSVILFLKLLKKRLNFYFMRMSAFSLVYLCTTRIPSAYIGQGKVLDSLELDLDSRELPCVCWE